MRWDIMFKAKTTKGKLVNVHQYGRKQLRKLRKDHHFICPECKGKVYLKIGSVKRPHFAHETNSTCRARQTGESEYHKRGKKLIYHWLKQQGLNVYLEKYLKDINRIPDIYLEIDKTKLVLEYQCSEIDQEELFKRMKLYQQSNMKQIWILGGNLLRRYGTNFIRLNHFMKNFIHQFNHDLSPVIYFFCPHRKQFAIVDHLYHTSVNKAYAQFRFKSLLTTSFLELFRKTPLQIENLKNIWINEKRAFRLHEIMELRKRIDWRSFLYEHSYHETTLPAYIYLPVQYSFLMREPTWYWQAKIALNIIEKNRRFSLKACKHLVTTINLEKPPLMKQVTNPVRLYIDTLENIGVIRQISKNIYEKIADDKKTYQVNQMMKKDRRLLQSLFI